MRGFRLLNGSWNTTWMRRRNGRSLRGRHIVDPLAIQQHLAVGRLDQPQDGPADGRFAASGFADQRQRLAAAMEKLTPSTA